MKISFVIPAYNEEACLGKCLESVFAQITNEHNAEVIVVNNASTDKTREIAASFPKVKIVDEPKKGLVQARRAGYLVASGELIANVDSDTILTPNWINKALKAFESNDNLVAYSGPFIFYDLPVFTKSLINFFYFVGHFFSAIFRRLFNFGSMLQGGNFVLRKTAFDKVGGFNPEFDFYGEDTDVARRICKAGEVVFSSDFPIYTSGRRLKKEGIIASGVKYGVNFLWTILFKKPFSQTHEDIRVKS